MSYKCRGTHSLTIIWRHRNRWQCWLLYLFKARQSSGKHRPSFRTFSKPWLPVHLSQKFQICHHFLAKCQNTRVNSDRVQNARNTFKRIMQKDFGVVFDNLPLCIKSVPDMKTSAVRYIIIISVSMRRKPSTCCENCAPQMQLHENCPGS